VGKVQIGKVDDMFENPQRKLKVLSRAVFAENDKYVDKFEALSVASVDIGDTEAGVQDICPEMRKLKALATELANILNEAYIEQQALLCNTFTEVQQCKNGWEALAAVRSRAAGDKQDIRSLENQLKHQLRHLYDQVSLVVDAKATILLSVQRVCDSYVSSTTVIGNANGVLHAGTKVTFVTSPHFKPLLNNRFFVTQEVTLRNPLVVFGGGLQYYHLFTGRGNSDHSPKYMGRSHSAVHKSYTTSRAAALDEGNTFGSVGLRIGLYRTYSLSLQHFNNQSAGTQWSFSVKIGSIAVLLLWALSECINNELSEEDIWNVSSKNW
jgi:hypothetical protein